MIDYLETSVVLIITTAAMLLLLKLGKREIKKSLSVSDPFLDLIFFFAYYKVLAYYALPALMNVLSDYEYVREDNIQLFDLAFLYIIEAISWLPWLAAFLVVSRLVKKNKLLDTKELMAYRVETSKNALLIFVIFFAAYSLSQFRSDVDDFGATLPFFAEIFKGLLQYGGPPASIFLMVMGFRYWGVPSGLVGLTGYLVSLTTAGSRGTFVYSSLFLFYVVLIYAPRIRYLVSAAFVFSSLLAFHFIFGGFFSIQKVIYADGGFDYQFGIVEKSGGRSAIKEIEWRFGALTRYSTGFITMYERGEAAGINPIKNSLLGFLPRSINPDKPIPSTRTGDDVYSQGMYLINQEIDGSTSLSMTEFSTGGHAYWELGWFGVFILNFISGLYIATCAVAFQRFGAIGIPLLVALFKPWGYVDPKIWVSDIVMQVYQIIIPIIVIALIVKVYEGKSRKQMLMSLPRR